MENLGFNLFAAVCVAFLLFLVMRELMCWYWKINKIVLSLESIQKSLYNISRNMDSVTVDPPQLTSDDEICPFCKKPSLKSNDVCENCGSIKK